MNTTQKPQKTLNALGKMDGAYLQANSKLKKMALWAERHDPGTHERVVIMISTLNAGKSQVCQMLDAYRSFPDLDRMPQIIEDVEKVQKLCEEAQALEVPKAMRLQELRDSLKQRTAEMPSWAAQNDEMCQYFRKEISELEKA